MNPTEELTQPKWSGRLLQWIILVALSIIPILNLILLRGWRIKVVEKMGKSPMFFTARNFSDHVKELFKNIGNLPVFFLKGAMLWIVHWIYWIPLVAFLLIFGVELFSTFWDISIWIGKSIIGLNNQTFNQVVEGSKSNLVIILISVIVYYFLYWPIFRAGMIRYSVEGKFRYLFEISKNIKFAQKYFKHFIPACIYATLVELILFNLILGISLLIPFVSYIIIFIILLPAIYGTTAFIYGFLARKIYKPKFK